jgi:putative holliday junction resolvase
MRTLAIDWGSRRIGLAMSDRSGKLASPLDVLPRSTAPEEILRLIRQEAVARLVVGLPLNMDGSIGPAATEAMAWGKGLGARCGLAVIFVDERLSSFAAEQQMIAGKRAGQKITRQGKKNRLDALAAAGFLQEFLDGKLKPIELP